MPYDRRRQEKWDKANRDRIIEYKAKYRKKHSTWQIHARGEMEQWLESKRQLDDQGKLEPKSVALRRLLKILMDADREKTDRHE